MKKTGDDSVTSNVGSIITHTLKIQFPIIQRNRAESVRFLCVWGVGLELWLSKNMLFLYWHTRVWVPVIQNGKLIGAVTHVLIDDPTKGFAIFAENMLETAQSVAEEKLKEVS